MLVGLFIGIIIYAIGIAARVTLPEPWAFRAWVLITTTGLTIVVAWFFAVRRGFRIHRLGRIVGPSGSRRKRGRKVR